MGKETKAEAKRRCKAKKEKVNIPPTHPRDHPPPEPEPSLPGLSLPDYHFSVSSGSDHGPLRTASTSRTISSASSASERASERHSSMADSAPCSAGCALSPRRGSSAARLASRDSYAMRIAPHSCASAAPRSQCTTSAAACRSASASSGPEAFPSRAHAVSSRVRLIWSAGRPAATASLSTSSARSARLCHAKQWSSELRKSKSAPAVPAGLSDTAGSPPAPSRLLPAARWPCSCRRARPAGLPPLKCPRGSHPPAGRSAPAAVPPLLGACRPAAWMTASV
eukprot:scaffold2384_cov120-Isochrysis_galbana.AAC.1